MDHAMSECRNGVLPTFLIIGAQKSGTRWLRDNLHEHPDIFAAWEEVSFFNNSNNFKQGLQWYQEAFKGYKDEPIVGESTPSYMMWRKDLDVLAARIDESLPDVKLMATLRNPIDRTYSAFLHHMRQGRIPTDADILKQIRSVKPEQDKLRLIAGGWYAKSLAPYVERFGDRLKVLLQDEIINAPGQVYARVLEHIGAPNNFLPDRLQQVRHRGRVPGNSDYSQDIRGSQNLTKPRDLTSEERMEIYQYFQQEIKHLEELLDRDLSLWRTPEEVTTC